MTLPVLAQAAEAAPSTAELVVFVIIGALALGSAVSMVVLSHPVHAALMLVLNFFTIAVLYAVNEAQFLATVQIIVYAGAIMVLFLFVIMLLGVAREDPTITRDRMRGQKASALVLGLVLLGALVIGVGGPFLARESACPSPASGEAQSATAIPCRGLATANEGGNTEAVGALLFTRYVWPFEVISVLLVIAAVGAMVLARRDEDPLDLVDRDLALVEPPEPEPGVDEAAARPAMIGRGNPAPSGPLQEDQ